MLQLLSVWHYLYTPRTPFKVICHHYTFTSHSAITRADIRMDEFSKCSTRIVFLKEIRDWICLTDLKLPPLVCSFPFFGHCLYSEGADLLQEIYKAVRGKMFTFLSKLLFENFQQWLLQSDLFACLSCAQFHGLGQAMCTFPTQVWKRMAVGDG